ncbi:MAG TPA: hypothetical protein VNU46_09505, partial [Gemmatimonadaceae bacterium]|nr:hypothetical protein [Gemmatimonadaceae bacterium]
MMMPNVRSIDAERRSRQCIGMTASVLMLLGAVGTANLSAQITYSVFPAVPQASTEQAGQPAGHAASLVTLVVRDSTVRWAVGQVARQAHLRAIYSKSELLATRVTMRVEQMSAMDAIGMVLRGTGLMATLSPDGETVVVHPVQ